ncbi:MAG: MASE1 domain-containing protein, partial [Woeseiaceae bacterium]
VFNIPEARYASEPLLVYGSFPLLLWAAVRFGPAGTSTSILLVAFLAIWAASHGLRPFGGEDQFSSARSVQLFLIVIAIPLMAIAIILREARTSAAAARSNEVRLALAVEAARMQTWDWDLPGDRMAWSTTRVAGGGQVMQAATASEFLGLVHPEDRNAVSGAFESAVEDSTPLDAEFRVINPDSSQSWLLMRGNVHADSAGKPARMVGISLNTTERKQIESQFRELREELAHMNRLAVLGELTGAMAHELNQPLTAILSNAEAGRFIVEKEPPELPIVRDILHDIVLQGRRAADVIRSLRTLLQKKQAEHRELDLNRIVRETLELERSALIARRVVAQLSLSADVPRIMADRVQLQQVLLNLIMNACQAMAEREVEGRHIILKTARE